MTKGKDKIEVSKDIMEFINKPGGKIPGIIDRYIIEENEDWQGWIKKIPSIKLEPGWLIKVIPPFAGAVVRFQITTKRGGWTSVYLDCYDKLGYMEKPYWEVYPYNGDTYRCLLDETDKLIRAIKHSLKERDKTL